MDGNLQIDDHYHDAVHFMRVNGGAFVRSLASAWFVADPTNRDRLRIAFLELFDGYERQYKAWVAQQEAK